MCGGGAQVYTQAANTIDPSKVMGATETWDVLNKYNRKASNQAMNMIDLANNLAGVTTTDQIGNTGYSADYTGNTGSNRSSTASTDSTGVATDSNTYNNTYAAGKGSGTTTLQTVIDAARAARKNYATESDWASAMKAEWAANPSLAPYDPDAVLQAARA